MLRRERRYTVKPKSGDALLVQSATAGEAAPGDILLAWTPGRTPADDTLACTRVARRRYGGARPADVRGARQGPGAVARRSDHGQGPRPRGQSAPAARVAGDALPGPAEQRRWPMSPPAARAVASKREEAAAEATWRRNGDLPFQRMDEETLVVDPRTREVHLLNETAARIWELLESPRSIPDAVRHARRRVRRRAGRAPARRRDPGGRPRPKGPALRRVGVTFGVAPRCEDDEAIGVSESVDGPAPGRAGAGLGGLQAGAAQRLARADPALQHPVPALLQLRPRRRARRAGGRRLRDAGARALDRGDPAPPRRAARGRLAVPVAHGRRGAVAPGPVPVPRPRPRAQPRGAAPQQRHDAASGGRRPPGVVQQPPRRQREPLRRHARGPRQHHADPRLVPADLGRCAAPARARDDRAAQVHRDAPERPRGRGDARPGRGRRLPLPGRRHHHRPPRRDQQQPGHAHRTRRRSSGSTAARCATW